jgi:hypothetical protein
MELSTTDFFKVDSAPKNYLVKFEVTSLYLRFKVTVVAYVTIMAFWDQTQCTLINRCQRFRRICYLQILGSGTCSYTEGRI